MRNKLITKIPILMYHEITNEEDVKLLSQKIGPSWISTIKDFESQIAYLRYSGYETIHLDRLIDYINGIDYSSELPIKPIVITFDDGFAGNYEYAFPILQGYGMTATFFVTVNYIEAQHMLTWDQLREMNKYNMSIQSHTLSHPLMSRLNYNATKREIIDSRDIIQEKLGERVDFISLPNGDYNRHYFSIAKDYGLKGGCSSMYGFNNKGTNPFLLRRIDIRRTLGFSRFRNCLDRQSLFSKASLCKSYAKRMLSKAIGKEIYHNIYKLYNKRFGG